MLRFTKDSDYLGKRRIASIAVCLFLALLDLVWTAYSDERTDPVVAEISIEVDGQPGNPEIRELISVKKDESLSLKKINTSIKQIYKSGLFSDVQVIKDGEQRIKLTFLLTKKLFIRKIFILGKTNISSKVMKEKIYALQEEREFTEDKLNKAVDELKNALIWEGEFFPEITTFVDKNPEDSTVDLFFRLQSTRRVTIKDIKFTGEVILPKEELKGKIESREGKEFIPAVLDKDLERLRRVFQMMGYQRAEVNAKQKIDSEKKDTVFLSLEIIPHERIEIIVRGARIPLSLLQPIWETRIFEEWGLAEGETKIVQYLRERGYLFSSVSSRIEKKTHKISVIYDVSPGERYKIQDISFKGLKYFTASQLKSELGVEKKVPFFGGVSGARLYELPRELEIIYKSQGFPHPRVDLTFEKRGKKVTPVFSIEEGTRETIQSLSIQGARLFGQEQLLQQIGIFQGGPFFHPNVQKDVENLETFYLNQGIRGTDIKVDVNKVGDGLFSVAFMVKEGNKVRIKTIVITGNTVTRKSTIQRELLINEGDLAFQESIRESKRRLERLGIFTEIKMEEIPLSPEMENLLISVREGERNYASLGLGLETKNEPRSFAVWNTAVRPRGTAELIRNNIFGSAAQLSLVGQVSLKEKRGVISWEQPYFFGLPVQSYLNAWLEREERKSFSFDRRGVSLTVIRSLSEKEDKIFLTTLRLARTTLFDLFVSESEVDRQHFPFSTTALSSSFIWDRRDDPFNPEKGSFFSAVFEWAYPLFHTESNYLKTFTKYQKFFPLFPGIALSSTVRLGLGRGRIPIHERFFGGGSNSFRGVEFDELGPKDPKSSKPVGGKGLILFNFELTFPFLLRVKNLYGGFFYDTGNVFETRRQLSLASFQHAVGGGLRYRTPLGPIRVELGWNLNPRVGEKKLLAFITIGNVF